MKIAIVTTKDNDLCRLLKQYAEVEVFTAEEALTLDTCYDAYALLGGADTKEFSMPIDLRLHIEAERKAGKCRNPDGYRLRSVARAGIVDKE